MSRDSMSKDSMSRNSMSRDSTSGILCVVILCQGIRCRRPDPYLYLHVKSIIFPEVPTCASNMLSSIDYVLYDFMICIEYNFSAFSVTFRLRQTKAE